jgi:hypothetical protein
VGITGKYERQKMKNPWIHLSVWVAFSYGCLVSCQAIKLFEKSFGEEVEGLHRKVPDVSQASSLDDLACTARQIFTTVDRLFPEFSTPLPQISLREYRLYNFLERRKDLVAEAPHSEKRHATKMQLLGKQNCTSLRNFCTEFAKALKTRSWELTGLVYQESWYGYPIRAWRVSLPFIDDVRNKLQEDMTSLQIRKSQKTETLTHLCGVQRGFLDLAEENDKRRFMQSETVLIDMEDTFAKDIPIESIEARITQKIKDCTRELESLDQDYNRFREWVESIQGFYKKDERFYVGKGVWQPYYYVNEIPSQAATSMYHASPELPKQEFLFGLNLSQEAAALKSPFISRMKRNQDEISTIYSNVCRRIRNLSHLIILLTVRRLDDVLR